jgi:hypothetical protein
MKKRQLTAILLTAAITLTLTLAACSGDDGPNTYNPAPDMTTDTGAQENRTAVPPVTTEPTQDRPSNAVWKEVPIPERCPYKSTSYTFGPFDLRDTISGYDSNLGVQFNNFIFRGVILSMKEYEVTWQLDNGEWREPFNRGIIEVRIFEQYSEESPVNGDIVRIVTADSLAEIRDFFSGVPELTVNSEYLFITRVMDEMYVENWKKIVPTYKGEDEKHGDVMSGMMFNAYPIENGVVSIMSDFFRHDTNAMRSVLSPDSVGSSGLITSDSLESGDFIAFNLDDFDREFKKLIANADSLPTVDW